MKYRLGEILDLTGGTLLGGNRAQPVGRLSTDTRKIQPGETFLALRGPNFRGEDFLIDAMDRMAGGAIVHRDFEPPVYLDGRFYIQVDDTLQSYGDIARNWRRRMSPATIAVSGSAGKTTTKEMAARICSARWNVLATEGNYNNLIGLPMTILRLDESHEIAIIETGMNVPGELSRLTEICDPDIAIITNIGNAHIGNFGSQEELIKGETEIIRAMRPESALILNADCPNTRRIPEFAGLPENVLTFGISNEADLKAENIHHDHEGYHFEAIFKENRERILLNLYGQYQVYNALGAIAIALSSGMSLDEAATGFQEFEAPRLRSEIKQAGGVLMICDYYNSSPDSMEKSIRSLFDLGGVHRRVVMMGDMRELGNLSEKHHREAGQVIAEMGVDLLCLFGEDVRWTAEEASAGGVATEQFETREDAAEFMARELQAGDVLLIKASRTMKFELIANRFEELRSGYIHDFRSEGHQHV